MAKAKKPKDDTSPEGTEDTTRKDVAAELNTDNSDEKVPDAGETPAKAALETDDKDTPAEVGGKAEETPNPWSTKPRTAETDPPEPDETAKEGTTGDPLTDTPQVAEAAGQEDEKLHGADKDPVEKDSDPDLHVEKSDATDDLHTDAKADPILPGAEKDRIKDDTDHDTRSDTPEAAEDLDAARKEDTQADAPVARHPLPVPAPPPRRGGFWPAVFGGIVAAALGFIAGRGDLLDPYFPRAAAPEPVDLAPLTEQTAALSARIEALEGQETPEIPDLSADFGDLTQSLDGLQSGLDDLTARIDELEARPVAAAPVPQEDNSEEIVALQSAIETLQSRLADEDARASAEAERVLARAALTRVMTAVESGETFAPALGDLESTTSVEVPDALRSAAAEGVPTLSTLRENFPDAARAALNASRSEVPEAEVSGIGGFLRRQLSARSVTPREGSDPDAILSRAEAALRGGDLDAALTELDALPEAATSAMQDWLAGARARKEASDAAKTLSESLTVN